MMEPPEEEMEEEEEEEEEEGEGGQFTPEEIMVCQKCNLLYSTV